MDKELIINSSPTEVEIALLEDKRLVELHSQKTNNNFSVGDIFVGRIKKLMPGLNAAFVDIGHRKDAFLHYTDLGPQLRSLLKFTKESIADTLNTHRLDAFDLQPDIIKTGKIDQVLDRREAVLVQILKEPISTKGPRLTCEVTIPGRYLVLTPFNDTVAVSKKVSSNEERTRLKNLVESIKPKKFGVIVRTAAEGKKVADLHEELRNLEEKWKTIHSQLRNATNPVKLLSEIDKTTSLLRDILNDSFNKVVTNEKEVYMGVKAFLESVAADKVKIASMYRGRRPIFDHFDITRQIKASFGKTSTMKSGAYIVIEHTEAMHVIDVNSGPKMQKKNQEDAAIGVNIESAKEIARQMRLRDLGGIVLIDFIDMRRAENRQRLFREMRDFMKNDRAQHTILPLSKFGLMQITRQRTRPEVKIDTAEVCSSCNGSGKVNATVLVIEDIQRDIDYIIQTRPKTKLELYVHPYVDAYLNKGWKSKKIEWWLEKKKWISIKPDYDYHINQYKFFDGRQDEIRLN